MQVMNNPRTPISGQLVAGLIILALGLLFLLDNLNIVETDRVFDYWPVILIVIGLTKMSQARSGSSRFVAGIWVFVGVLFLLDQLDMIDFDIGDLWPVFLILLGGALLGRALSKGKILAAPLNASEITDSSSVVNIAAFMGGVERRNNAADFRGGELTVTMGGIELDLREASIQSGEAVIDLFAMWGGIELRVPESWEVIPKITPIMGGYEEKVHTPKPGTGQRLILRGWVIMGGVEVRN
jgi:predicted membrane protein